MPNLLPCFLYLFAWPRGSIRSGLYLVWIRYGSGKGKATSMNMEGSYKVGMQMVKATKECLGVTTRLGLTWIGLGLGMSRSGGGWSRGQRWWRSRWWRLRGGQGELWWW